MGPAMNSFYSAHDISNEMNPSSPHSTTDSTLSMTYHSPMTTATTSTSVPSDIHNHQTSAAGGNYTSSTMLPNTIAPSYPLYSYPQAQPNHSSSLLSYATPQQSSSSSSNQSHGTTHRHSQPSSWDSTISLQPSNSVYGNGIYNFGNNPSHNGTDQYQMTPSNSGT